MKRQLIAKLSIRGYPSILVEYEVGKRGHRGYHIGYKSKHKVTLKEYSKVLDIAERIYLYAKMCVTGATSLEEIKGGELDKSVERIAKIMVRRMKTIYHIHKEIDKWK